MTNGPPIAVPAHYVSIVPGPLAFELIGDAAKTYAEASPPPDEVVKTFNGGRRRKPTVAQVIHEQHGGPDPATLPRRRRKMGFPERWRFHTHDRRTRSAPR
jgi:hypothetical protein